MTLAALSFTLMVVCVRYLENRYPSVQVVFFRALVGLVFVIPPLMQHGFAGLGTKRIGMHLSRAVFAMAAMLAFYYGVVFVPLADAMAYTFIIPLFATVGAALILREIVDMPRWAATLIGFIGTLVIIRPGHAEFSLPVMLMILSAAFYAGSWISLKFLTRTESASIIVLYMNVLIVPLALIPTLFVGTMPTLSDLPFLIAIGGFGSLAHFFQAKSYAAADASAVIPFDFLRLPFSVVFAWFLFAEPTNLFIWIGAVIIFASTWYISWHESRAGQKSA